MNSVTGVGVDIEAGVLIDDSDGGVGGAELGCPGTNGIIESDNPGETVSTPIDVHWDDFGDLDNGV